jgi:hypothetical protein
LATKAAYTCPYHSPFCANQIQDETASPKQEHSLEKESSLEQESSLKEEGSLKQGSLLDAAPGVFMELRGFTSRRRVTEHGHIPFEQLLSHGIRTEKRRHVVEAHV